LVSVFSTLDDFPDIRFYDPKRKRNTLSARVAENLHEQLLELSLYNPAFPSPSSFPSPAILVIVDRSVDFLTPLLHTLSYQSLVHDFFPVVDRADREEKHVVCKVSEDQYAVLDDSDEIFMSIRHKFLDDAIDSINSYRRVHRQAVKEAQEPLSASTGGVDRLMDMMSRLEILDKRTLQISALLKISNTIKNTLRDPSLLSLVELEQDLAVGERANGEPIKYAFEEMFERIQDKSENVLGRDRLRLFLIYVLTVGGLTSVQKDHILATTSYRDDDRPSLEGLRCMGANVSETLKDPSMPSSPFTPQRRRPTVTVTMSTANPQDPLRPVLTTVRAPVASGGGSGSGSMSDIAEIADIAAVAAATAGGGGLQVHTRRPEHALMRCLPALYYLAADVAYARPVIASWFPSVNHPDSPLVDYSRVNTRGRAVGRRRQPQDPSGLSAAAQGRRTGDDSRRLAAAASASSSSGGRNADDDDEDDPDADLSALTALPPPRFSLAGGVGEVKVLDGFHSTWGRRRPQVLWKPS
ncbi:vacuolar sorting protein VPS33/slp1, partial [Cladochytrium tenue]